MSNTLGLIPKQENKKFPEKLCYQGLSGIKNPETNK
jgi:hypothetical protein